jgi:hypothetical protein
MARYIRFSKDERSYRIINRGTARSGILQSNSGTSAIQQNRAF